ncbi:MAG: ArsR/SmtB family transcription factor [Longimicrobiales bacterium]
MDNGAVFDRLATLSDPTRARLLLLLERFEMSVSELCEAVQLPQSTVSRHLRHLVDQGWLQTRAEGPSRYYRLARSLDGAARRLWKAVQEQAATAVRSTHDEARARSALKQRRTRSQQFFATAAAEWDQLRAELFGESADLGALLALLDDDLLVADLGCGTGAVATKLAPFVRRVIGVDESRAMLSAARRRLADYENVELRAGELEALPLEDGAVDLAILSLVLHYVAQPAAVLDEARRILADGGRLLVVDMIAHARADLRERMGHVWQGFDREQIEGWVREAGFERVVHRTLPPDRRAQGPVLFALTAVGAAEGRLGRQSIQLGEE